MVAMNTPETAMYDLILQTRQLSETVSTAALKTRPIYQIRFDRHVSPDVVNGGDGWTERHAKDWLNRRDLNANMSTDEDYLRAKQGPPPKADVEMSEIDIGVMVIRCTP